MKRLTVLVIFILAGLALASTARAQGSELTAAEQAYRSGDYTKAAELYQSVLSRGLTSGEIYYNLGNCYYKVGQYGRAILNYKRAERLLGQDPDLEINLRLANLNVPDRIEPLPRFFLLRLIEKAGESLSARGWASLLIIGEWALLACLGGLVYLRSPGRRRLLTGVFTLSLLLLVVSGGFHLLERAHQNRDQGVVIADKTEVHSAPEESSTELFALHGGTTFIILRQVPGWAEVHLADGKQGWMPKSVFEVI
jgi:tetratricopeptide (TPR) repeat protein